MKVVCTHCGLPFSAVRAEPGSPTFCCTGCALAFRLASAPDGAAPSAPVFLPALGAAFLFFNQALGALLAVLAPGVLAFGVGSLAIGAGAWGALLVFQRRHGAWRASDRAAAAVVLPALVWAAVDFRPGMALIANTLLLAWSLRGLARKSLRVKR